MDKLIFKLFDENWTPDVFKNVDEMKKQLHKNLTDQTKGFWSGSTAYYIMSKGGFLVDGKSSTKKELTELGKMFIQDYEKN